MNVIFLDIDGVLVTERYMEQVMNEKGRLEYDDRRNFDPVCVENLKRILTETDSKLVISSSWRHFAVLNEFDRIFSQYGLAEYIIDQTPILWTEDNGLEKRGNEIQKWLDMWQESSDEKIESFVILDDDDDMLHLMPYLVQTDFYDGINDDITKRAIEMLQKQKERKNASDFVRIASKIGQQYKSAERER